MYRLTVACVAAAACLIASAAASSPDAWSEHDAAMRDACFKASEFKNPKALSTPILFDDSVGYDAMVVEGEFPQDHMKGMTGQMLCLFNKSTQKAQVSEIMKPE